MSTSTKTTVQISKISGNDLYCHYDRQTSAQDCYVELDCRNGTLSASYNAEIGNAVPFSVYHGHEQRFGIPMLTAAAVNALMDQITPLAQRVIDGYESDWNGNNMVATFTDDAQAAIDEIREICDAEAESADESNSIQEWDAGDWLDGITYRHGTDGKHSKWDHTIETVIDGIGTITAKTTDAELDEMEKKIEADCDKNVVINKLEKFLREERDNCRENTERFSD